MSSKRIKKKHMWLGAKRAGLPYCSNQIGQHVHRLLDEAGIKPIRRNIMRYLHWFYRHSTEAEWTIRVDRAYMPYQPILSAKHLLPKQPTYDQMVLYSRRRAIIKERVFTPYLIKPDDDIHIEPEFVDGDLISFSLCRNENESQEENDE